jgi:hypothetical protein
MKAESNCRVLGTGSKPEDFAHVKTGTPMDLKRREFQETKQYRTELAPDINQAREKAVSRARRTGNVRPMGGSGA